MKKSAIKVVKKAINWCKSVKNNIDQFSYENDDEEDCDEEDCDDDYFEDDDCDIENDFENVISCQRERLEILIDDLDDLLEDYDGQYEDDLHQAKMSIYTASEELQDIENNISHSLNLFADFNDQIENAVEYLDDAIDILEDCISGDF